MVCQETAVLRAKAMIERNYFTFPSYSSWLASIIKLVQDMATYGRTYYEIMTAVKEYSPQNGCTEETKMFEDLATRIAVRDLNG